MAHVIIQEMSAAPALPRWPDESVKVQRLFDVEWEVREDVEMLSRTLPEQHRLFHSRNISFLPLAVLDPDSGRVWTSMLAGKDGEPGFIDAPDKQTLIVHANTWPGDPATRYLASPGQDPALVAGVGVELTTRRRNKLAGSATVLSNKDHDLKLEIKISQALGNCPKYITLRSLESYTTARPVVEADNLNVGVDEQLPETVRNFILERDTCFLSTHYVPSARNASTFPQFLGCNHRGGRPGFVRIRSDGRTLVLPDHSGNRHWSSLGAIESNPIAGLTFVDFESGDVLYVTGQAKNFASDEAKKIMPRARMLTTIGVSGFTFVRNALPFRQSKDANLFEPSPYSPPVHFLVEERPQDVVQDVSAKLIDAKFHLPDGVEDVNEATLATFTFSTTRKINSKPGGYAVLDMTPLVGQSMYRHMARGNEASVNDDGVRTWTISASPDEHTFSLTIRKVDKGRVTPRLYANAARICQAKAAKDGTFVPKLELPLLGVGGDFLLPEIRPNDVSMRLLLVAGGIGSTPFLRFLEAINHGTHGTSEAKWRVHLILATREPDILARLIVNSLGSEKLRDNLNLSTVFVSSTPHSRADDALPPLLKAQLHTGRVDDSLIKDGLRLIQADDGQPHVYLCGPPAFEKTITDILSSTDVPTENVHQEKFNF
ncbi:hypothetical protein OIV83_003204 [Microbotryomycetes sp. JL201]|nr:hypothetical protein OIV83_003204 [Microbotryomycetes sp. JL201]